MPRYVDAHCHLHDPRFSNRSELLQECQRVGILHLVVNGTCAHDWPDVVQVCKESPMLIPSFGWHPWFLDQLPHNWLTQLRDALNASYAAVGEIGLDSWRKPFNQALQEEVFTAQITLAAELNRPASIHGLRAWDRVLGILKRSAIPQCGFLLHSYGGPVNLIPHFVALGGYFSCPGFFLRPGNEGKLALFKEVPLERLLIESDAPDQALPEALDNYRLMSALEAKRINHPATLLTTYEAIAHLRSLSVDALAAAVYDNFNRLFSPTAEGLPVQKD